MSDTITRPLTYMNVPYCADVRTVDADAVIMGVPCCTPYLFLPEYGQANLKSADALRENSRQWFTYHDRYDWDVDRPYFSNREHRIADIGNLAVDFYQAEANRKLIRETTETIISRGAVPFMLGGEDSTPIPVIQGLGALGDVTVLQLDAHMDWRDDMQGERWGLSSGMRRASELPFVKNIIQVGMRGPSSGGPREVADALDWGVKFIPAEKIYKNGIEQVIDAIPEGANVHINLDLDVLDPSFMPSVWVPTPGGLTYWDVLQIIKGIAKKGRICSFGMVEYIADRDPQGIYGTLANRLAVTAIGEVLAQRSA